MGTGATSAWLLTSNDGYILQADTVGSVQFGFFEAQQNVAFTNATINGTFAGGTWFAPVSTSPNATAQFTFSNGNISGTTLAGAIMSASGVLKK